MLSNLILKKTLTLLLYLIMIKIDKLVDSLTSFLKERFDLMKVDIVEKISSAVSTVISFFILFLVLLFVIGFASISLGNYLNESLDSSYLGYSIITLIYIILFFTLFIFSKSGKFKNLIESEFNKGLKK
tara:strand:+ start:507 stop:893 length:387 start_codon:yes stop_codon:yes gene_type:complete